MYMWNCVLYSHRGGKGKGEERDGEEGEEGEEREGEEGEAEQEGEQPRDTGRGLS